MSESQQQQQQQQHDSCIDDNVMLRATYTAGGDFDGATVEGVVSGAGPSSITLFPATNPGYGDANSLTVTSTTTWTKAFMGNGQIVVILPHPAEGETHEWGFSFGSPPLTPLTVKIRKTRGSKEGSESPK